MQDSTKPASWSEKLTIWGPKMEPTMPSHIWWGIGASFQNFPCSNIHQVVFKSFEFLLKCELKRASWPFSLHKNTQCDESNKSLAPHIPHTWFLMGCPRTFAIFDLISTHTSFSQPCLKSSGCVFSSGRGVVGMYVPVFVLQGECRIKLVFFSQKIFIAIQIK
jgi:hypothetical protein